MYSGKAVFAQLVEWIHPEPFRRCVLRYLGHYKVRRFTCWEQFLAMAFAQVTFRESLADLEVCPRSRRDQLYHLGFHSPVAHSTLAHLYKLRWRVELFFKWIKQTLRIKHFFGTSDNAVKTQVWIAVCVYVLAAIVRKELNLTVTLSQMLQIASVSAFEKVPLAELFAHTPPQDDELSLCNHLLLWD